MIILYRCVQVAGFLHGKGILSMGNQIEIISLTLYGLRSLSLMTNFSQNNSGPHVIFLKYSTIIVKSVIRSFVQCFSPHVSLMSAAITSVMSNDTFTMSIMVPGM